jgi:hypothetical protein
MTLRQSDDKRDIRWTTIVDLKIPTRAAAARDAWPDAKTSYIGIVSLVVRQSYEQPELADYMDTVLQDNDSVTNMYSATVWQAALGSNLNVCVIAKGIDDGIGDRFVWNPRCVDCAPLVPSGPHVVKVLQGHLFNETLLEPLARPSVVNVPLNYFVSAF